ncbi:alpha-glucuronidase family glycosyl hydrolase [Paenibacillus sp. MMS18-CY102]|uniref:alpha-glucuronidase family glycosyl hydrolase n=1 Tax=Paenibacillus sp. MMS18-CY102 TaxID=2682849 RepID=UPI0013654B75|nr:alpha-glucuronidase family glycosyl hydrolase [Paenibacillus sp. MMS18-CY102]MWC28613.1 alpha-glucuronidase [Paenibacillus sp. MMS18-CY102]
MGSQQANVNLAGYKAWLAMHAREDVVQRKQEATRYGWIASSEHHETVVAAVSELVSGIGAMLGQEPRLIEPEYIEQGIIIGTIEGNVRIQAICGDVTGQLGPEGFVIRASAGLTAIGANTPAGVLYGAFHLLRLLALGNKMENLSVIERPANALRMINQWDNVDGSIERGYAGKSIFYADGEIVFNPERIRDYARLLASVGMNAIAINNVNVHRLESHFITEAFLPRIAELAAIFRTYGIRLYLSINFASPIEVGGVLTADPLEVDVRQWWKERGAEIYSLIPDFGGFLVKADSENRPGPFTYGRNHADGANMLAEALAPYGGVVIWRCFVYDCKQDWRDRSTDRARAAYDHFMPLDGEFHSNVLLQIKNGPMDFQVREPVSPLFGAMERTNQLIEFQITQEYTGQQLHLCYLVPQWKAVLDFDTLAHGEASPVKRIVDGTFFGRPYGGFAAVSNIGCDGNWTGHLLAQANLYGYGRLAWNPELTAEAIAAEWAAQAISPNAQAVHTVCSMMMESLDIYESYTAPLGVGWMVNPDHHYGPNVDGYEYDKWGTYHFADRDGVGVDRTVASGTGYAGQYIGDNAKMYESLGRCPDELLLFFHHVPYTHKLQSGVTVIQHIYNTHFDGAERAAELAEKWQALRHLMPAGLYRQTEARLLEQAEHAKEWRDRINTYFYRKSGIADAWGRTIY